MKNNFEHSLINPLKDKTMKRIFAIVAAVLFTAAMFSCEKENDNNSEDNDATQLADNTLVYDGQTYTFDNVVVDYYHSELTLVSAFTNDTLDNGQPRLALEGIHITPTTWNASFDLANASGWPDDALVSLHLSGILNISFEAWCNEGAMGGAGDLDGVHYENESIFSSGTYKVSGFNNGTPITITYDGVLKNGKKFQAKIVSKNYDV